MIQVVPPDDWEDDQVSSPEEQEQVGDSTTSPGLTDFGDIDQVLSQGGQRSAEPRSKSGKRPRVPTPGPAKRPSPSQPNGPAPILPDQQWTSPQARKRRQWVTWLVVSSGGLLIVAALVTAVVVNFQKPGTESVAKASPDETLPDDVSPDEDATSDPSSPDAADPDDPPDLLDQTPLASPIDQQQALDSGVGQPPVIPGSAVPDEFEAPDADAPPMGSPADDGSLPLVPPADDESTSAAGGGLDPAIPDQPMASPIKPLQDELGDLAGLLEYSDTSIQELQDQQVVARNAGVARMTKYFVEPPDDWRLDLPRQREMPVDGLIFEQPTSLTHMVRVLTRLSGIPITIDARQLVLMGQPVNPNGALTISDATVQTALEAIAQPHGLDLVESPGGLVLTVESSPELETARIPIPEIPGLTVEDRQRLIASIQTLVAPDLWVREADPGSVELDDRTLVVRAPAGVVRVIQQFLEKLGQAAAVMADPDNPELRRPLVSRWTATETIRQHPSPLSHSIDRSILEVLNELEQDSGLTVVVDWYHLVEAGWPPTTQIPGELVEPTCGDVLEELAAALNWAPVAVDAQTFVMTTTTVMRSYVDLEIYPVAASLADQLTEGQLEKLMFNLLGDQVQINLVKIIYEPKVQGLIVIGPQPIQRQVETALQRLQSAPLD